MRQKHVILAVSVALATALAACSSSSTVDIPSPEPVPSLAIPTEAPAPVLEIGKMAPYETTSFTVDYPKNWTVIHRDIDPDNCPTTVCFYAPGEASGLPIAVTMVAAIPTDVDLETTWKQNKTLVQSTWSVPATLKSSEATTWNSEPAIKSIYDLSFGGLPSEGEQTMMVVDGVMYAVSGGAQQAYWKEAKDVLRQMLDSFELISGG